MSKLDDLKEQIKRHLELCDKTETPTVCAMIDTEIGFSEIQNLIVSKVLYGQNISISDAIVEIEDEYNINTTD